MSVAERVAQGVKTLAAGVQWGTAGSPPAGVVPLVVVRKRPEVAEQDETSVTKPTAVVVVREASRELVWAGKYLATYLVGIAVAVPTAQVLGNTSQMGDWLEAVGKGVQGDGTLPTLSAAENNEIRPTTQRPWDSATLDRNFDWGTLGYRIEVLEDRA